MDCRRGRIETCLEESGEFVEEDLMVGEVFFSFSSVFFGELAGSLDNPFGGTFDFGDFFVLRVGVGNTLSSVVESIVD